MISMRARRGRQADHRHSFVVVLLAMIHSLLVGLLLVVFSSSSSSSSSSSHCNFFAVESFSPVSLPSPPTTARSFIVRSSSLSATGRRQPLRSGRVGVLLSSSSSSSDKDKDEGRGKDDEEREDWDSDVDYEKEFPSDGESGLSPDPALGWNVPKMDDREGELKLGIDIGSQLQPLSDKEAAELKAAATEIINDAVAEGIDELEKLRSRMKKELESKTRAMQFASELNAQRESEKLLSKIDALTESFLKDTDLSRAATKLAAAADRNMEGRGVEVGVWGNLEGAAVTTDAATAGAPSSLLGSVDAARGRAQKNKSTSSASSQQEDSTAAETASTTPRIVVVADTKQDDYAKKLVDKFTGVMEEAVPGLQVTVYSPASTLPLGGDNADCALLFGTSLSDKSSVANALDRLLRKTLQTGGAIGSPPTQICLVSTVGTERTNKMPYSFQNMMGGKLDKRRDMEETLLRQVKDRVVEPPLDYTIIKLGTELNDKESSDFQLMPGDCLDGNTRIDTAVTVIKEAIAFQPSARNSTLCCIGDLKDTSQADLDDWFLRLDGPEVWRETLRKGKGTDFDVLVEYLRGWADLLGESKNLITPIRTELSLPPIRLPTGVTRQEGVQLLFLPTATGKNYLSRDEEKALAREGSKTSQQVKRNLSSLSKKEGGIEVLVEVMEADSSLRVRAKRCNYGDDAVIKELSEETIVKRLEDSLETWMEDHA